MREHTENQAWHWDGLDHSSAAQLLQDVLPVTDASPLVPLGQGDFCLAFRHREKVIRVARHAEAVTALRRETCVLARIADRLPLPVPRLAFYDPQGCPPFTTHPEIRGDVLTREAWRRLPAAAQDRTAVGLADFLLALHPLLLGSGIPLFAHAEKHFLLEMTDHKSYPSGHMLVHYRVRRGDND